MPAACLPSSLPSCLPAWLEVEHENQRPPQKRDALHISDEEGRRRIQIVALKRQIQLQMAAPDLPANGVCCKLIVASTDNSSLWNKPTDVAMLPLFLLPLLHLNPSQSTAANSSLRCRCNTRRCRGKCVIDLPHATLETNPRQCVCVCAAGNFIWAHAILLSIVMKPTTARGKEEAAQANHSASCSERFDWPLKLHVSVEGAALAVPRDVWVMCKTWTVDKHNRRASDASACSARSVRCQARCDSKWIRIL